MIKASTITLLLLMIIQVSLIPESQAKTARYDHPSVKTLSTEIASIIGSTDKHIPVDVVQSNIPTPHSHLSKKQQCARQYGHKGRCGSCLCLSLFVATPVFTPVALYKPEGNYLQQDYPLRSIFISPPFRPPIG